MLYSHAVSLYLKYCYNLAERTRIIYQDHLSRLQSWLEQDCPLADLDHYRLIDFMAGLKKQSGQAYAPGYLSQIYRSLHSFFEYCRNETWIEDNPMARVPRPRLYTGPKPRLSLDQVRDLIREVKLTSLAERNLAIILLMVDSGLRLDEVVKLRAADVYRPEGLIYVRSSKTLTYREVPISPETVASLTDYLIVRPAFKRNDEPFFLTRDRKPLTKQAVHLLMKRLQQKLGYPLHCHLLRHTFANLYIREGNLRKLQKILGHSRIDTTARFYTDPDLGDIQNEHRSASPLGQLRRK